MGEAKKTCDDCSVPFDSESITCHKCIAKGSEQRNLGTTEQATHYQVGKQQPIEIMQETMTNEQIIGFLLGNTIKYALRMNHKGRLREDAGKCCQYAEWLCQVIDEKKIIPGKLPPVPKEGK